VIIIFSGIALFGVAVAALTSSLTITGLPSDSTSLDDLTGKRIGVIQGTFAAEKVATLPVRIVPFESVTAAAKGLEHGDVSFVVHDLPLLQFFAIENPDAKVFISSKTFIPQNYGITFSEGSPLFKDCNTALLELLEDKDSEYYFLHDKWFGITK